MVAIFYRKKGLVNLENKLQIFEPKFDNPELEEDFNNFFYKYNLISLFTNEHRATPISVSYVDARSVINAGGSYHVTLKNFSDFLTVANDNKSYEEAVFKIIYEARSFQGLIRAIKKLMDYMQTIKPDHKFNLWNIVFYNKDLL